MSDRLSEIEARLERLEGAIRELRLPQAASISPQALAGIAPADVLPARPDAVAWLTLAGRTLMVLGGAYLLRALTESGRLPVSGGVVIGLGYALAWLGAADWAGVRRGHKLSSAFHGFTAVLIAVPLLLEASTRFQVLSPEASALALCVLTLLALAVAWHGELQSVAGMAVIGSIGAAWVLAARSGRPVPAIAALLATGAGALVVADIRGWAWLRWPAALAADLSVIALTTRGLLTPPADDPRTVTVLQGLLVLTYAAPAMWRTLVRSQPARPFDVLQTAFAVAIGLGGAWVTLHTQSIAVLVIAGLLAVSAAGAYAVAFGVIAPLQERRGTLAAYLTVGAALAFASAAMVLRGAPLAGFYAGCALALMYIGARVDQPIVMIHGAVFAIAAAVASQIVHVASAVWLTTGPWASVSVIQIAILVVIAACLAMPSRESGVVDGVSRWLRASAAWMLATLVIYAGGALLVPPVVALLGGATIAPGVLASVRTVTLAVLALVAALAARAFGHVGFRWLVYPLLVTGGLKLLVDDFPHSSPITLFPALAAYGAALILAPRLARGARAV